MAGKPTVSHVISRTALDGFVLGDMEKEYLLTLIQRLSAVYFTDSGVIGTKAFVSRCAQLFERHFSSRHAKPPRPIAGLPGIYALKRLSEARSDTTVTILELRSCAGTARFVSQDGLC